MVTTTYTESKRFPKPFDDKGAAKVDSKEKSLLAARAALEKKASDLVIFAVGELTTIADYFIICSAESLPQIRAIRDHIEKTLSERGDRLFGVEGGDGSAWLLMDYSDLIIHIFKEDARSFYSLERLWGDAPQLEPEEKPVSARVRRTGKITELARVRPKRQKRAGGL